MAKINPSTKDTNQLSQLAVSIINTAKNGSNFDVFPANSSKNTPETIRADKSLFFEIYPPSDDWKYDWTICVHKYSSTGGLGTEYVINAKPDNLVPLICFIIEKKS